MDANAIIPDTTEGFRGAAIAALGEMYREAILGEDIARGIHIQELIYLVEKA